MLSNRLQIKAGTVFLPSVLKLSNMPQRPTTDVKPPPQKKPQCCLLSYSDLEHKGTWHDWCSWRKIFCNFPYSSRSKYNLPSCNEKKVEVLRSIQISQLSFVRVSWRYPKQKQKTVSYIFYLCVCLKPQSIILSIFQSFKCRFIEFLKQIHLT